MAESILMTRRTSDNASIDVRCCECPVQQASRQRIRNDRSSEFGGLFDQSSKPDVRVIQCPLLCRKVNVVKGAHSLAHTTQETGVDNHDSNRNNNRKHRQHRHRRAEDPFESDVDGRKLRFLFPLHGSERLSVPRSIGRGFRKHTARRGVRIGAGRAYRCTQRRQGYGR